MPAPVVALDAHHLARPEGNRTYVRNLLLGLARGAAPPDLRVVAHGDPAQVAAVAPGLAARRLPLAGRAALRVPLGVPWAQVRDRPALWHAAWAVAPWARAPLALVVHDVLFATHAHLFPAAAAWRLRVLVAAAARRARRVLVPTRATRDALLGWLPGLEAARVVVVPFGLDREVFDAAPRPGDDARRAAALGSPPSRPYVLAVGRPDRRKDLPGLLGAAARAPGPALGAARVVVAGPLGPRGAAALAAEARAAGLAPGRLALVDAPDEATLAALYRGCAALAFPSRAEGVGLPVLEALACGARVVASALPSVAEVVADAGAGARATLVPPGDAAALAGALEAALAAGPPAGPPPRVADVVDLAAATVAVWRAALA